MKRFISVILLMAMMCTMAVGLAACQNADSTDQNGSTTNTETEAPIVDEKPDISGYNYEGEVFNTYILEWGIFRNYIFATEETGESMNDALYRRERMVEEDLGLSIENTFFGVPQLIPTMQQIALSNDVAYDLVLAHCIDSLTALVTNHFLYNWMDIPNIDMDKSYWNQSMNNNLSIDGKLFFAINDYLIPDPNAIFFSKSLAERKNIENLYDLVDAGTWTLDKFIETARGVSEDLDGNGQFDKNDQYGFAAELDWQFSSFLHSSDQFIVQKNDEGLPELCLNTEKTISIIEKIYNLLYGANTSWTWPFGTPTDGSGIYIPFESGRALFYLVSMSGAKQYRATDFDFGILPYPKYDDLQEKYLSTDWSGLMCAPVIMNDPERFGIVVELLGYYGNQYIMPEYFDVLLDGKLSRDDESQEMLEIIFDNIVYDFGLNLSNYGQMLYCIMHLMRDRSVNFASFYATHETASQKTIDDVVEAYQTFES